MKTVVHIGQHKTGTTSIQGYLQENRDMLKGKGIYIPAKVGGFSDPSHFVLNLYALDEDRYSSKKEKLVQKYGDAFIKDLKSTLRSDIAEIYQDARGHNCHTVLWSNEGLYLLNSVAEYKRLLGLFSEYSQEFQAVCCFRDVESYRASYIKQLKRQGLKTSRDPDSYRYTEPDSWLFDYERKKRLLSEVFDSCLYFDYNPQDNVGEFLKTIGIEKPDRIKTRLNTTPPRRRFQAARNVYRKLKAALKRVGS